MKKIIFTILILTYMVGCLEDSAQKTNLEEGKKTTFLAINDGIKMKLVKIPAGSFMMGSSTPEKGRDEKDEGPQHKVTITRPFYMSAYEVTQEQYKTIMGANPSDFKGPNRPVEMVSWNEAVEFCKKLTERTGYTVRLPTEAEWEYACRAGTNTRFYFGDNADDLHKHENYCDLSCTDPFAWNDMDHNDGQDRTAPVGSYGSNNWGLHDMHGNVTEWCSDWYGDYKKDEAIDPTGPETGKGRVVRGGSWLSKMIHCRSTRRGVLPPTDFKRYYLGFRVVVECPE